MKKIIRGCFLSIVYCILPILSFSQPCAPFASVLQADIPSTCNQMVVTITFDALGRPYLYVANKEAGLKVYNISALSTPSIVATVPISLYDSLHVMSLSQNGNYLYLALGNSFATSKTGMAIVDVTTPSSPTVTDYWELTGSTSGAGIVKVEGNYAYLGGMQHGLLVLDVSNKSNIAFVSQFIPNINWPVNNPSNPTMYNARGMEVKNSIVYLCYDAGGIRIINCTNKAAPKETGRWCNPVMYTPLNHPKAYNNIVLNDTLAYVAVDYAGMEVLNVKDTGNITMTGWWNPYNSPNNNWFTSPSHANELAYDSNCERVYLSTGKSDMIVVDVNDPTSPDSCNYYGGVSNGIGTWGIAFNQAQYSMALSYICTLGIPFASNWTGVKLLSVTPCNPWGIDETIEPGFSIFPVPAREKITIEFKNNVSLSGISIENMLGQKFQPSFRHLGNQIDVDVSALNGGCYFLKMNADRREFVKKFTKE